MAQQATEEVVEQEFAVGEEPSLFLRNISGRVSIRASEEGVIRVRAVKHGRADDVQHTHIHLQQAGNAVHVETKSEEHGRFGQGSVCSVDYDVTVPHRCIPEVTTVSADVDLHGTAASATVETVSGIVSVADISGTGRFQTVSGDITARDVRGTLHLHTTSGSADLGTAELESFDLHSISGTITVETPLQGGGTYRAQTVSSDVRLRVPEMQGISVHLHSVSGRVFSDLPASIDKVGFGDWNATINGGGPDVWMSSVSGGLRITRT
ncbi:MAG TPA: DUF4097 family beta strand repeat-containing protein [Chloroflexota bacterium]